MNEDCRHTLKNKNDFVPIGLWERISKFKLITFLLPLGYGILVLIHPLAAQSVSPVRDSSNWGAAKPGGGFWPMFWYDRDGTKLFAKQSAQMLVLFYLPYRKKQNSLKQPDCLTRLAQKWQEPGSTGDPFNARSYFIFADQNEPPWQQEVPDPPSEVKWQNWQSSQKILINDYVNRLKEQKLPIALVALGSRALWISYQPDLKKHFAKIVLARVPRHFYRYKRDYENLMTPTGKVIWLEKKGLAQFKEPSNDEYQLQYSYKSSEIVCAMQTQLEDFLKQ